MSHLVALNNALADGEIVNIHGDRVFGSSKVVKVRILGAGADLPLGPFMLASMRNVPAIAVFVMRNGYHKYKALLYRLDEGLEGLDRNARAEKMAQEYASRVDSVIRMYPDQWFNFYEYWDE
jgi:predicted LPLAT superfamily acyltransferase